MKRPWVLPFGLLAIVLVAAGSVRAATGTWTGPSGGTWNTGTTNWSNLFGTPWDVTNGGTNTAVFNTANFAATVNGSVWANAITFNQSGTVSGGTITLAGSTPAITVASLRIATIGSTLDGSAGLQILSGGTLALNGSNTYSGTTSFGTTASLILGNAAALGTSVLSTKNTLIAGTALTGANKVTNNLWVSTFTIGGSNAIDLGGTFTQNTTGQMVTVNNTGATTFSGPMWILSGTASNATLTFAGLSNFTISGTIGRDSAALSNSTWGNLRYFGSGTMTLSAANTFGGNLSVAGGGAVGFANAAALGPNATLQTGSSGSPGALVYTGAGVATGKTVRVGINSGDTGMTGILDHSGSGLLSYATVTTSATNATNPTTSGTLVLRGSTSGTGQITGVVGQQSGVTLSVAKQGSGSWLLSGVNTYSGSTSISAGVLEIGPAGSINASSGILLNGSTAELRYNAAAALTRPLTLTKGTISGTGTIAAAVAFEADGSLSPGNSPGTQSYTNLHAWRPLGTYRWELNALTGVAGTNWDLVNVTSGTFDLSGLSTAPGGRFVLNLITLDAANAAGELAIPFDGGSYTLPIASYSAANFLLPGGFTNTPGADLTDLFTINLGSWQGTQPQLGNVSVRINSTATGIDLVIVPEPGGLFVAGIGIAMAAWSVRIRRRITT